MHLSSVLTSLALLVAYSIAPVHAGIYVTAPVQTSQLTGGQQVTVSWIDDGQNPLLSSVGECTVGVYTGEFQLVQSLPSVDVSTAASLTFTLNPAAGPDGQYYLVFLSQGLNYYSYSASFTASGMSGSTTTGGSSTPASTLATTSPDSSTSVGPSTTATTPTDTATSASTPGTSSVTGTDTSTPTGSTSAPGTTATGTTASQTLTTPTSSATTTRAATTTTSQTSTSASATPTSAAVRIGSSASFGGVVVLLALSGVLAF